MMARQPAGATRQREAARRDNEAMRGRRIERRRNNQPARREDERVARGATRGRGEAIRQQAGATRRQSVLLQDPPRGGVPFHDDEGSYGSFKSADRRHVHRRRLRSLVVRLPVDRYRDIIGHQGLTRVVDQFPRFARAIERYLQRNHLRELIDGSFVVIEGLEFSPWDAFAFIDNSIDDCNVPYAGPLGDWPGEDGHFFDHRRRSRFLHGLRRLCIQSWDAMHPVLPPPIRSRGRSYERADSLQSRDE